MLDLAALTQAERDLLVRYHESQLADLRALTSVPGPSTPAPAPDPNPHPGFPSKTDEGAFYDFLRDNDLLGPKISASEFKGCDAITRACAEAKWPLSWTAYSLATTYLETAHTMQPIDEYGGTAYFRRRYDIEGANPKKARELGNLTPGDGAKFHGRGYVQLTGRRNYTLASAKLGVDLVANPALALDPEIAAQVMVKGMREGRFTSRDIDDDLPADRPATKAQFERSRDIINGRDRQSDVADYALTFQKALQAGKWVF